MYNSGGKCFFTGYADLRSASWRYHMKFTEGYWLRKESVQPSFAAQAFTVEKIPHGMRITVPERPIINRSDAMDQTVMLLDFVSAGHNDICVTFTHFEGYTSGEARFLLHEEPDETQVEINDSEAVVTAGDITVRADRATGRYQFEAGGKILTSCGFRNAGYMRVNKKPTDLSGGRDYFRQDYEPYMLTELSLKPGECVYGLGERFTALVKNGQRVDMWNEDGGTASQIGYKNIPFYMTNEGYGIFVDSTGNVSFEAASEKVEYVGFSVPGEQLRYHLFYGKTPADITAAYTALTGRPALPPAWSFGLWLTTSFKPKYDEETTSKLIDGMQSRHIPLRVFHFDCYWMRALHWCDFEWDGAQFDDVKGMMDRYHKKGLKICAWVNPYLAQNNDTFRECADKGYFLMRSDGHGIKQVDNWQPGLAIIDFTNPDAAAWYAGRIKGLLSVGVDCIKTDFGERIPVDVRYHDGSDPVSMHNYFTYLYNRTVFEAIQEVRGKDEAVLFARSATAGSQQFPVHWGGDSSASYGSMAETLRGGLSFAMSGFSFWSHDISGFESTATPDLYKRWVQFGLLSTHSRLHGSDTYRVPWLFDDEACDVLRTFVHLKCRLMPYIYAASVTAHSYGTPVMRPMPFEYPDDPACRYLDMQYMLGPSLLVAPIFNDQSTAQYYLPEGTWTDLFEGTVRKGGTWYTAKYDYFHLPLYVRENSMIPWGNNGELPDYDYTDHTVLRIYQPKPGAHTACTIPDLHGSPAAGIDMHVSEDGTAVTLDISGRLNAATYEIHTGEKVLTGTVGTGENIISIS